MATSERGGSAGWEVEVGHVAYHQDKVRVDRRVLLALKK